MPTLCRDCFHCQDADRAAKRCAACGSPRTVTHGELAALSIAHLDADAFYASIEKRDDPALADRPVIVGGGRRGVVAACCYVARIYGVRSAMPMFKALKACPEAVVLRPDMEKYRREGRALRDLMLAATPLVEPLSVDEAFLDLAGTERLHHGAAAETLARLARRVEAELGLTVSIGLSYNKFLAKIASDLDKPRGFSVIGRADALDFLASRPVGFIWGVGDALERKLHGDGIRRIGDLRAVSETDLVARYGAIGRRLAAFARGEDPRPVVPDSAPKSISAETTFDEDIDDLASLRRILWTLSEKVARRLKKSVYSAGSITLKLKTAEFRTITRSRRVPAGTQSAERIFRVAVDLLEPEVDGRRFRLIGVGGSDLAAPQEAPQADLLTLGEEARIRRVEDVMDTLRERLGEDAIVKGRALDDRSPPARGKPR